MTRCGSLSEERPSARVRAPSAQAFVVATLEPVIEPRSLCQLRIEARQERRHCTRVLAPREELPHFAQLLIHEEGATLSRRIQCLADNGACLVNLSLDECPGKSQLRKCTTSSAFRCSDLQNPVSLCSCSSHVRGQSMLGDAVLRGCNTQRNTDPDEASHAEGLCDPGENHLDDGDQLAGRCLVELDGLAALGTTAARV